jgi:2-keto-4-pentenoate hydratase/2-oxohepta-3-ene-1,7-dioic acid hydratase in catechol pathway
VNDPPQKIVCVGPKYRDHAEEQGVAFPERPLLGVGAFRDSPVWLTPGDEITIEIDCVGSITNPVTG